MRPVFQTDTVLFVGNGRLPMASSITTVHGEESISFAVVVDMNNGNIVDAETTFRTKTVNEFIRSILVGRNFETDYDQLLTMLRTRIQGAADKAIVSAFKGAYDRYTDYRFGNGLEK